MSLMENEIPPPNPTRSLRRPPVSLRLLAVAVVALVAAGAVTVFGSAFVVNRLKDMLVNEARQEAKSAVDSGCQEIRAILARQSVRTIDDIAALGEIQEQLRLISRERGIVMAALLDPRGRIVYARYCDKRMEDHCSSDIVNALHSTLEGTGGVGWKDVIERFPETIIPLDMKIVNGPELVGSVYIAISRDLTFRRIDILSEGISSSLTFMVLSVFLLMLMTLVLTWYSFQRQFALTRRASEAERMAEVGALASGMAHEIRNPLHAMNLHLSVAREDLEDPASLDPKVTAEAIGRVQRQIEHLNGIVSNFLSLAIPTKMELREMPFERSVQEVTGLLVLAFKEKGIELEVSTPEPCVVRGDVQALHQVLINLLLNAQHIL